MGDCRTHGASSSSSFCPGSSYVFCRCGVEVAALCSLPCTDLLRNSQTWRDPSKLSQVARAAPHLRATSFSICYLKSESLKGWRRARGRLQHVSIRDAEVVRFIDSAVFGNLGADVASCPGRSRHNTGRPLRRGRSSHFSDAGGFARPPLADAFAAPGYSRELLARSFRKHRRPLALSPKQAPDPCRLALLSGDSTPKGLLSAFVGRPSIRELRTPA